MDVAEDTGDFISSNMSSKSIKWMHGAIRYVTKSLLPPLYCSVEYEQKRNDAKNL